MASTIKQTINMVTGDRSTLLWMQLIWLRKKVTMFGLSNSTVHACSEHGKQQCIGKSHQRIRKKPIKFKVCL